MFARLSPLALVLLLLLALLMPMKSDDLFNGLPLDSGTEAVGFLLVVPLLLSSGLRGRWSASLGGRRLAGAYAVVVAIIILKAVSLAGGPEGVYTACYPSRTRCRSPAPPGSSRASTSRRRSPSSTRSGISTG
jgi:integral membrane sensor domain MASE1